jgi:hypothetical protein
VRNEGNLNGRKAAAGRSSELEHFAGKDGWHREKELTRSTQIKSHRVSASEQNPEYLVESEKSGKQAAHKAGTLKKLPNR